MHIRASNSKLVEPLPEPERTMNRRLRQRNRRVPYDQRNNSPQHPRIVYPLVLNINYFYHFLDILQNYDPMVDEPMWATDHVVAPTPGSTITIPETANEFAIKGNHLPLSKGKPIRSGKSYNPSVNPNDQQNDSETPINFDSDDEDEESTPQLKNQNPKPVKETSLPKPYKPKIPYPQRLKKEKMEAQYEKFLDMIHAVRINVPLFEWS
ncbi:hypothetical protein Tco_0280734 [Tanacetum coccineum]